MSAGAIRGRFAPSSDGNGKMCEKADLLEHAARLGLSLKKNFCRCDDDDGRERLCPHFHDCRYLSQFRTDVTIRFLATGCLTVPEMLDDTTLRIIDETFWRQFVSIRDVFAAAFTTPRTHPASD